MGVWKAGFGYLYGSAELFFAGLWLSETFLQNPKGSAEFLGGGGSPERNFWGLSAFPPNKVPWKIGIFLVDFLDFPACFQGKMALRKTRKNPPKRSTTDLREGACSMNASLSCSLGARPLDLTRLGALFSVISRDLLEDTKCWWLPIGQHVFRSPNQGALKSRGQTEGDKLSHIADVCRFLQSLPFLGTKELPVQYWKSEKSPNLAPVLVIVSGNSLVFSRTVITSTVFYRCCALTHQRQY